MLKIGIINGPNLNILGKRDQKIYGNITLEEINCKIKSFAEKEGIKLITMQTNFEGENFRGKSVTAPACIGQIAGFGCQSYILAFHALQDLLKKKPKKD